MAGLLAGHPSPAVPEELTGDVVLAADATTVTWAAIHRRPAPAGDDPWYHIEVVAKDRRSEPWIFRRLSAHMAITPEALLASRSDRRAKTYGYKPEQFRGAYGQWREQPREVRERDVCRRTVLDCLARGPAD
ncbi:MAG: DUF5086 family protein [Methylobacterium frigidaeris]